MMTVPERRKKVGEELQQAQQQAQAFGQQATQWAQRVLYLQGQLDLLNELDPNAPAPKPGDKVVLPTRAERRRQEKVARANGGT